MIAPLLDVVSSSARIDTLPKGTIKSHLWARSYTQIILGRNYEKMMFNLTQQDSIRASLGVICTPYKPYRAMDLLIRWEKYSSDLFL